MASLVVPSFGLVLSMAAVRLSAAQISASAAVNVGIVNYLCLKNTVSHVLVPFVSGM